MATESELIEREAKRRCVRDEVPLTRLACEDRRYRHDDRRPWWEAEYVFSIKQEIEGLRRAGFTIRPGAHQ